MPARIEREEVRRLVDEEKGQLVEVLPHEEYEQEHLPGAVQIGLGEIDEKAPELLDKSRPVIAYCNSSL